MVLLDNSIMYLGPRKGFCRGKAVESYKGDVIRIVYIINDNN
jgi:hypothetical protein